MSTLGIYIHVPFCAKKCGYCDFYSVGWSKEAAQRYTEAAVRNLRYYSDRLRVTDTVYFGGGTPSLLGAEQISCIIGAVREYFLLSPDAEITLEANPSTLSAEKLRELRVCGVNRISFGVQSLIDRELKILGRLHTAERAVRAVCDAHSAGFTNISCDLMAGLPMQTMADLRYSISELSKLPIQHISSYILKIEDGTPFSCGDIRSSLPDDDAVSDMYIDMVEELEKHGFMQYEISNFSRPGFESRHNCRYWKCMDYIGIGPSAHSCNNGKRFAVGRDIAEFLSSDVQQTEITDDSPCGFEEFAMLRLRLHEGLHLSDVLEHRAEIEKKLPPVLEAGYAEFDGETVRLTPKGAVMSNAVIGYIIFG